jgi:alpha,alpha-trehalose phosphorylase
VLKQADVVLAMFLRSENFTIEQKRRNFDYYDPITTGDSSLSACAQAIVAADVGYDELALDYFHRALYLDLCDSHGNTTEGIHVASAGGVWAGIVHGFAGMRESGDHIRFSPRIPRAWERISFHLRRHSSLIRVDIDHERCEIAVVDGEGLVLRDGENEVLITAGTSYDLPIAPRPED